MRIVDPLQHFIVNPAIGGQHKRLVWRESISLEVCDLASCFLYDQKASCAVPGLQIHFIKSIEAARCYPAKVNSCGAKPAYRNSFANEPFKDLERAIRHIEISIGEAGYQAGADYLILIAHFNLAVVEPRTLSLLGKEKLVHKGIEHCSHDDLTFVFHRNGDTADRNAIGEIDRSVDRVDDPPVIRVHFELSHFFTYDVMVGEIFPNDVDNSFFRFVIRFRHQVIDPFFVADLDLPVEIFLQDSPSGPRGFEQCAF